MPTSRQAAGGHHCRATATYQRLTVKREVGMRDVGRARLHNGAIPQAVGNKRCAARILTQRLPHLCPRLWMGRQGARHTHEIGRAHV